MMLTVVLDPDVAERIHQEVRREGKSAEVVVNETLRERLGLHRESRPQEPFRVQPHDFGFIAGLDLDKMSHLADELEAAAAAQKLGE
jgi:hypothetical protein